MKKETVGVKRDLKKGVRDCWKLKVAFGWEMVRRKILRGTRVRNDEEVGKVRGCTGREERRQRN
jgi:hypothetical protein